MNEIEDALRMTINNIDNYVVLGCFEKIKKTKEGLNFKLKYNKRNLDLLFDLKKAKDIDIRGFRYHLKFKTVKLEYKENDYNASSIVICFDVHRKEYAFIFKKDFQSEVI